MVELMVAITVLLVAVAGDQLQELCELISTATVPAREANAALSDGGSAATKPEPEGVVAKTNEPTEPAREGAA